MEKPSDRDLASIAERYVADLSTMAIPDSVDTRDDYETASQFLVKVELKALAIRDAFLPSLSAADEAVEAAENARAEVNGLYQRALAPFEKAKSEVGSAMAEYRLEQERQRREDQADLLKAARALREKQHQDEIEAALSDDDEAKLASAIEHVAVSDQNLKDMAAMLASNTSRPAVSAPGVTMRRLKQWELVDIKLVKPNFKDEVPKRREITRVVNSDFDNAENIVGRGGIKVKLGMSKPSVSVDAVGAASTNASAGSGGGGTRQPKRLPGVR
jgi:hypothetical protein